MRNKKNLIESKRNACILKNYSLDMIKIQSTKPWDDTKLQGFIKTNSSENRGIIFVRNLIFVNRKRFINTLL